MSKVKREFGKHYLVELIGCDTEKIKYTRDVEGPFLRAARKSKTKLLEHFFHQFRPVGVTGFINIAWSHFAIHTWPEESYVAVDIFTCGEMSPEAAIEELKRSFKAKKVKVKIISRGF